MTDASHGWTGLADKVLASARAGSALDADAVGIAFVASGLSGADGDRVAAACREAYARLAGRGLREVALDYARAGALVALARLDERPLTA